MGRGWLRRFGGVGQRLSVWGLRGGVFFVGMGWDVEGRGKRVWQLSGVESTA